MMKCRGQIIESRKNRHFMNLMILGRLNFFLGLLSPALSSLRRGSQLLASEVVRQQQSRRQTCLILWDKLVLNETSLIFKF
jgi:hypothetical protein